MINRAIEVDKVLLLLIIIIIGRKGTEAGLFPSLQIPVSSTKEYRKSFLESCNA